MNTDFNSYWVDTWDDKRIYDIDGYLTILYSIHGNFAKGSILNRSKEDYTLTPCYVAKGDNGVFAHGETLRKAQEALNIKLFLRYTPKQRVAAFKKRFPDPKEVVPNTELFEWHNKLTGSCEMGRRTFAKEKGIDIDNGSMSIKDFLELTKDSYGGCIIKMINYE